MIAELPTLCVPLPRRLFELSDLAYQLFALDVPSSEVFLQLVLEISNFWIQLGRIFGRHRTAHDLGSASKLDGLTGHLQLFLFPLCLCAEERLFDIGLFLSDAIEFELELFLYGLRHAQRV